MVDNTVIIIWAVLMISVTILAGIGACSLKEMLDDKYRRQMVKITHLPAGRRSFR